MNTTPNPRIFEMNTQNITFEAWTEKDYYGIVIHHAQYTTKDHEHLVFSIDSWHKEKAIK